MSSHNSPAGQAAPAHMDARRHDNSQVEHLRITVLGARQLFNPTFLGKPKPYLQVTLIHHNDLELSRRENINLKRIRFDQGLDQINEVSFPHEDEDVLEFEVADREDGFCGEHYMGSALLNIAAVFRESASDIWEKEISLNRERAQQDKRAHGGFLKIRLERFLPSRQPSKSAVHYLDYPETRSLQNKHAGLPDPFHVQGPYDQPNWNTKGHKSNHLWQTSVENPTQQRSCDPLSQQDIGRYPQQVGNVMHRLNPTNMDPQFEESINSPVLRYSKGEIKEDNTKHGQEHFHLNRSHTVCGAPAGEPIRKSIEHPTREIPHGITGQSTCPNPKSNRTVTYSGSQYDAQEDPLRHSHYGSEMFRGGRRR